MSKILEQNTEFTDLECLRDAWIEAGAQVVCDTDLSKTVSMKGYNGSFSANLGIQKQELARLTGDYHFSDLGYRQQADGTLKMITDDIDVTRSGFQTLMDTVGESYAEKTYAKELYAQGLTLVGTTQNADGEKVLQFAQAGLF